VAQVDSNLSQFFWYAFSTTFAAPFVYSGWSFNKMSAWIN
jgi:hypothetical protein